MELDINLLRNLVTVAAFATFAGIVWWAFAPSRRQRFEEIGKAILEKGDS
jgi:cbb3-type cytochrome oxidase subunit 3